MKRLAYISAASPDVELADLEAILTSAVNRNGEMDVTGVLLFNGLNFLQILEGSASQVAQIYSLIIADKRHSGVVTILDEEADERIFPDWSMQLAIVPASVGSLPAGMQLSVNFLEGLPPAVPDHIRLFLTGFNSMSRLERA